MKLTEIFGTSYFLSSHVKDIDYFITSLIDSSVKNINHYDAGFQKMRSEGEPYVFDLAGAHLCKDAMTTIVNKSAYKTLVFIDTDNGYRNSILEENVKRCSLYYVTTPLPIPKYIEEIPQLLESLDEENVYCVPTNVSVALSIRWIALISLMRPSIKIDVDNVSKEFFSFLSSVVDCEELNVDSVTYLVGTTHYTEKVVNGMIYDFTEGLIPLSTFTKKYCCIPGNFGKIKASEVKEYYKLAEYLVAALNTFIERRKTITSFF